jgi:hypothetical protein
VQLGGGRGTAAEATPAVRGVPRCGAGEPGAPLPSIHPALPLLLPDPSPKTPPPRCIRASPPCGAAPFPYDGTLLLPKAFEGPRLDGRGRPKSALMRGGVLQAQGDAAQCPVRLNFLSATPPYHAAPHPSHPSNPAHPPHPPQLAFPAPCPLTQAPAPSLLTPPFGGQGAGAVELLGVFDKLVAKQAGMDAGAFNDDGTYKGCINQVQT